jgi:hypothetical protein
VSNENLCCESGLLSDAIDDGFTPLDPWDRMADTVVDSESSSSRIHFRETSPYRGGRGYRPSN